MAHTATGATILKTDQSERKKKGNNESKNRDDEEIWRIKKSPPNEVLRTNSNTYDEPK